VANSQDEGIFSSGVHVSRRRRRRFTSEFEAETVKLIRGRRQDRGGGRVPAEARWADGTRTTRQRTGMRVVVDFDLCESNATCMGIAPEVFEVSDDDLLYILQEEPPEDLRPKLEEAVRRCPKQAISLEG
jgi:ferredoxin